MSKDVVVESRDGAGLKSVKVSQKKAILDFLCQKSRI